MADYDKILPITKVKENLLSHVKDVQDLGQSIAITRNGKPSALLMNIDEYEGLLETIEILSNEKLMKILRKSIKELKAGQFVTEEEVWKE